MSWLTAEQISRLPMGTAVVLDLGDHRPLIRGRVAGPVGGELVMGDGRRVVTSRIQRGRVVNGTYEMGDLVLKRGVPSSVWRGGVIRTNGLEVLVEGTDGIAWVPEHALEPVEKRVPSNARAREEGTSPVSAA